MSRQGQPGHDTALGRGTGRVGRAGRRWGVGAGALKRRARGSTGGDTALGSATRPGARSRALRHGRQTHGACDRGARHGRWERGLGVLLGCGLCTWCTQPIFDPVLLSTVPESIFGNCS